MKQPTFIEGVVVALISATTASILFSALKLIFPADTVLQLLIPLLSLGYIGYLMSRGQERRGRVTAIGGWLLLTLTGVLLSLSLLPLLLLHSGYIWFIRSLYHHHRLLAAAADLMLTGLSLAASVWAMLSSGSLFMTIWCFFLTQALFVFIPKSWPRKQRSDQTSAAPFDQAYQTAQRALAKLASHR